MALYRNPAHLLGLGHDAALIRLLRACGMEEDRITGKTSDYDKFLTLAAALPLCEGHPARARVEALLQEATGLNAPLCPHTAEAFWKAWVARHWYGESVSPAELPLICPHCAPVLPLTLHRCDGILPPDLSAVHAPDLPSWSRALEDACTADHAPILLTLPADYAFVRPDPYHANLAVRKAADGGTLTQTERDLLVAQALRVWGGAFARDKNGDRPTSLRVILEGGLPDAVTALLSYLEASKTLPPMAWIPRDPAHAAAVSGVFASVRTGFAVAETHPPEATGALRRAYAAVAPVGCAVILMI